MNELLIRDYQAVDYDQLCELFKFNIPAYFAVEEYQDFEKYLREEIEHYFVVEMDAIIVGCGGINYMRDAAVAMISWDIVHPEYQGRGIGSCILNYRIAFIKHHYPTYMIIVRTSQLVYPFYEKQGFKLLEKHKDFWAKGFDMYKMEFIAY